MNKKNIYLIFIALITLFPVRSHPKVWEGHVHRSDSNEPLLEANVYLTQTKCGTVTDSEGYFHLECHSYHFLDSLKISYLGFYDYIIPLESFQHQSTIYLNPKNLDLEDAILVQGERINILRQDIPHKTIVIEFEEIERYGSSEIADIFKPLPSVQVEGNDLDGRTIQIRGSDPEEVNVYVDGILINHLQMNNAADLSLIPVESIDNIEIVKGGNLAFLGGGAFGGVVNITTRKKVEEKISIKAKLGSFQTKYLISRLNFLLSQKFSINYFGQFNQFSPEIEYFPDEKYSDKTSSRDIKTEKQNHHLNFNYFLQSGQLTSTFIGYFLTYDKPAWTSKFNNYLSALTYKGTILGVNNFDINLNYLNSNNKVFREQVGSTRYISKYLSNRLNIRIAKQFGSHNKSLQLYSEYFHDELINNLKVQFLGYENNLYHADVYDNRLSGAAVLSLSDQVSQQQNVHAKFYAGSRVDFLANGDNDITNMIGIQFDFKRKNMVISPNFNYGQNIKYPTLLENAYLQDITGTVSSDSIRRLEPEYSTGGDIGISLKLKPSYNLLNQVDFDFSLFSRIVYNKILRRPFDDIIAQIPTARSETKGLEGSILFKEIYQYFNLNLGYTKLDINNPLPNAYKPESKASIQLQYFSLFGLFLNSTLFYEGKSTVWYYNQQDEIQTDEISPHGDMDLSIGYKIPFYKMQLSIQFSGYNIFDNSSYQYYYLKKRYLQFSVGVVY